MYEGEGNREVNIQEVIPLVEKKPVLWDHREKLFKHRDPTLAAWDEICSDYNEAYANLSQAERNNYRGIVIRKWRNVKDSWRKNLIKTMKGEAGHKKYIYDKQLLFLKQGMKIKPKKKRKSSSTTETLTDEESSRHSEFQIKSGSLNTTKEELKANETDCHNQTDIDSINDKPEISTRRNNDAKLHKPLDKPESVYLEMPSYSFSPQSTISNRAESEVSQLFNSGEREDRHISFIKGVLPSLRKFNEKQVLKFQMGVLQLIQNIQENTENSR